MGGVMERGGGEGRWRGAMERGGRGDEEGGDGEL